MKNKLYPFFKYTLLSHSKKTNSNQGFVLPIILGFGLFMLLVAIMMINRSGDDKVSSIEQEQTAESLGVAEGGISKALAILNQGDNRVFLKLNYNRLLPGSTTETYFGPKDTNPVDLGWDTAQISAVNANGCGTGTSTKSVPIPTELGTNVSSPVAVTNNGVVTEKGSYNLLAYKYDATSKIGTMLLQANSLKGTNDDKVAKSRLKVNFQVSDIKTPIPMKFPGLLASEFLAFGNNVVTVGGTTDKINVLCTTCTVPESSCVGGVPTEAALIANFDIKNWSAWDTQQIELKIAKPEKPPMPKITDYSYCNPYSEWKTTGQTVLNLPDTAHGDQPASNGTYCYQVTGDIDAKLNFTTSNANPVIVFFEGNIKKGTTIGHTGNFANLSFIGKPEDPNNLSTDQLIEFNGGNSATQIFIYAPDAQFGIMGGSSNPAVEGVFWVKTYGNNGSVGTGSSSSIATIGIPTGAGASLATRFGSSYNGIAGYETIIKSGGIVNWERQEAN